MDLSWGVIDMGVDTTEHKVASGPGIQDTCDVVSLLKSGIQARAIELRAWVACRFVEHSDR